MTIQTLHIFLSHLSMWISSRIFSLAIKLCGPLLPPVVRWIIYAVFESNYIFDIIHIHCRWTGRRRAHCVHRLFICMWECKLQRDLGRPGNPGNHTTVYISDRQHGNRSEFVDCAAVCHANILTRYFLHGVYIRRSGCTLSSRSQLLETLSRSRDSTTAICWHLGEGGGDFREKN